jgi:hypothetical protein
MLSGVLSEIIAQVAVRLPEVVGVGVLLRSRSAVQILATHGPVAEPLDVAQLALGAGPALEAIDRGCEVLVADVAGDPRWRSLWDAAPDAPVVTSVLALPLLLPDRSTAGAVTLYSAGGCRVDQLRDAGHMLTAGAAGVMQVASCLEEAHVRMTNVEAAMRTRSVIDQAIGIVMAEQRCSDRAAFRILQRASQNRNVKLRELCRGIIEAVVPAELPGG